MFCLAMRRDAYEQLGPLDERVRGRDCSKTTTTRCARTRPATERVCADDVFVHHFGEASFGKLVPTGEYATVLEANKASASRRSGARLAVLRPAAEARATRRQTRAHPRRSSPSKLPAGATVLVVSRGDEELLSSTAAARATFPQTEDGLWAGHHPADSERGGRASRGDARGAVAEFLVVPADRPLVARPLRGASGITSSSRYRDRRREEDTCVIFALDGEGTERDSRVCSIVIPVTTGRR